jgi:hypothetical protein
MNRHMHHLKQSVVRQNLTFVGQGLGQANDVRQSSLFCSIDDVVQQDRDHTASATVEHAPEHYGWSKEHIVLGPKDEEPLSTCKFLGK